MHTDVVTLAQNTKHRTHLLYELCHWIGVTGITGIRDWTCVHGRTWPKVVSLSTDLSHEHTAATLQSKRRIYYQPQVCTESARACMRLHYQC